MAQNALLDILQAASNAAASNVSGPVDIAAWLLGKVGLPIQKPIGGSEWMAERGLTKQVDNPLLRVAGETAGMLAPVTAAAKAPQIARGLLEAGQEWQAYNRALGPAGASQATVWHGSPHKFDKFDASKIGTGEGAQAYGHGLYLADAPGVAKTYAEMQIDEDKAFRAATDAAWQFLRKGSPFADDAITWGPLQSKVTREKFVDLYKRNPDAVWEKLSPQARTAVEQALSGNLYKVDLPDNAIAKMLDWDKPVVLQGADMLVNAMRAPEAASFLKKNPNATGGELVTFLSNTWGETNAVDDLRRLGIPGIKYLDGVSRSAGQGTRNYVVFPGEEDILTILERNGVTLP